MISGSLAGISAGMPGTHHQFHQVLLEPLGYRVPVFGSGQRRAAGLQGRRAAGRSDILRGHGVGCAVFARNNEWLRIS